MKLDPGDDHTGIFFQRGECEKEILDQAMDAARRPLIAEYQIWGRNRGLHENAQPLSVVTTSTYTPLVGKPNEPQMYRWELTLTASVRKFYPGGD